MHVMNIYALIPGGVNRKKRNEAQGTRGKAPGFGLKPQVGDTEEVNKPIAW
jgi:hypothetical protein